MNSFTLLRVRTPEEREVKRNEIELLIKAAETRLQRMRSACAKIEKLDGLIAYHKRELLVARKLRTSALREAGVICRQDRGIEND